MQTVETNTSHSPPVHSLTTAWAANSQDLPGGIHSEDQLPVHQWLRQYSDLNFIQVPLKVNSYQMKPMFTIFVFLFLAAMHLCNPRTNVIDHWCLLHLIEMFCSICLYPYTNLDIMRYTKHILVLYSNSCSAFFKTCSCFYFSIFWGCKFSVPMSIEKISYFQMRKKKGTTNKSNNINSKCMKTEKL